MRVRLTLDGHREDVLAVIGLALENGILDQMETVSKLDSDELPDLDTRPKPPGKRKQYSYADKRKSALTFQEGTRVAVKYERGDRPHVPPKGSTGVIVRGAFQGRGYAVVIKWDEIDGVTNEQYNAMVPSSMLTVVRKVPASDRRS